MLKIRGTEIQQRLSELKLDLAGYEGFAWNGDLSDGEEMLLNAAAEYNFSRASTIYGGSTEVQYTVMSKALLGL